MSEDTSNDTTSPRATPLANAEKEEMLAEAKARLGQMVEEGTLTGTEADQKLSALEARIDALEPAVQASPGGHDGSLIIRDPTSGRFAPGSRSITKRNGFHGLARHVRDETRGGLELVEFALRVLRDEGQVMKDRLSALAWLGDRGFGRPVQAVELVADVQAHTALDPAQILSRVSEGTIRELLAAAHDSLKLEPGNGDGDEP